MATEGGDNTGVEILWLLVGPQELSHQRVEKHKAYSKVVTKDPDPDQLLDELSPPPGIILCTLISKLETMLELGQLLSSLYREAALFLLAPKASSSIDRKQIIKNGFTDVFYLPIDEKILQQRLDEAVANIRQKGKIYKAIKLIDVSPENSLNFDTFLHLPQNNKYIKYSNSGSVLGKDRAEKLKKFEVSSLMIAAHEMNKFYSYTAKRLKALNEASPGISETERVEKLASAVRDLFSSFFSSKSGTIEIGKEMVQEGQKIVKTYIAMDSKQSIYQRILSTISRENDAYTRASNLSTFAALFSIALGFPAKATEDIALAGLIANLGFELLPLELLEKPESQWTDQERELYESHTELSLKMIRDKKLIINDLTRKIIAQHHERVNGSGYPKKLSGDRICPEAQILGVADWFNDLTSPRQGKAKLKPLEAMNVIYQGPKTDPSKLLFDPTLLEKIMKIFQDEGQEKSKGIKKKAS